MARYTHRIVKQIRFTAHNVLADSRLHGVQFWHHHEVAKALGQPNDDNDNFDDPFKYNSVMST